MKNDHKYLQFPLCLLQQILAKPVETINKMISYGIWYYSRRIEVNMEVLCRQYVYDYSRNQEALCSELISLIDSINETL